MLVAMRDSGFYGFYGFNEIYETAGMAGPAMIAIEFAEHSAQEFGAVLSTVSQARILC
jgi:hypothetical protein